MTDSSKSSDDKKTNLSQKGRSIADITEEDLWNLDDEEDIIDAVEQTTPESTTVKSTEKVAATSADKAVNQSPSSKKAVKKKKQQSERTTEDNVEDAPIIEEDSLASDLSQNAKKKEVKEQVTSKKESANAPLEKLLLLATGLICLGLATWLGISAFGKISTTHINDDKPNFPIKGEHVVISNIETYWRAPVLQGEKRDILANQNITIIPVILVKLSNKSESGNLRVLFRDQQENSMGDSISHSFSNGVFDENGKDTIEFAATSGFQKDAEYNSYRVASYRWNGEISETGAEGKRKHLVDVPISTEHR